MELNAEHPVRITHPDKLLWPDVGITKLDYIRYLIDVAPWFLPHLQDKPVTVIRYPDGVGNFSFYQKDMPQGAPDWVTTMPIWSPERSDDIHYIVIDSVATLMWLGNLAALEFHVGFATGSNPEVPTNIAFDLDPTVPGFDRVREVALELHHLLSQLGLPHVAKTSGATGLQIFVPLRQQYTFADTRVFTEAVARYLQVRRPDLVTLERLKKHRKNKVYVDFLQHGAGRTLIAPYSPRAVQAATVSTPLRWEELEQGCVPEDFTLWTTRDRLKQQGDLMYFGESEGVELGPLVAFLEKNGQFV